MIKKSYIFGGVLGIVVIGGLMGLLIWSEFQQEPIINNGPSFGEANKLEINEEVIETDWDTSGDVSDIKKPDLTQRPQFTGTFSDFDKGKILQDITNLQNTLTKDHENIDSWLDLGIQFKVAGDYKGAEEIWQYAAALKPKQSIAFSNLGLLYGYYLHETARGEANLLQAIENDPKIGYYYLNMADFYLDALKNKQKAVEILEKGLLALPGDVSLKKVLDSLE